MGGYRRNTWVVITEISTVSLGGDSDTQACIAGGIAEAFYGIPDDIIIDAASFIPQYFKETIIRMAENSAYRDRMEQLRRCWGEYLKKEGNEVF